MTINDLMIAYPDLNYRAVALWTKKFSEVHLADPHCCNVPKLGNNYSVAGLEENRDVCPDCLANAMLFPTVQGMPADDKAMFQMGIADIKYDTTVDSVARLTGLEYNKVFVKLMNLTSRVDL